VVAQVRSQVPTALPGGATTDAPFQPLSQSGYGNPSFYHAFFDDFDNALGATGLYTTSATGGTVAHSALDGGNAHFSVPATSTDFVAIQLPAASYQLPQGTTFPTGTLGKKLFYGCRINGISTLASYVAYMGLIDTTATVFTTVTDGVYFSLATAGINLVTVSSSTALTWTIPTSAYSSFWAAATQIDLAFWIDWYQNIHVYVGQQLFGYIPQSGTSSVNSATGVSLLPNLGACLTINGPNYQAMSGATGQTGPWTVSSALLNLTAGIKTTAATAVTMDVDFHLAQKER
jgi:hypothetical protein